MTNSFLDYYKKNKKNTFYNKGVRQTKIFYFSFNPGPLAYSNFQIPIRKRVIIKYAIREFYQKFVRNSERNNAFP